LSGKAVRSSDLVDYVGRSAVRSPRTMFEEVANPLQHGRLIRCRITLVAMEPALQQGRRFRWRLHGIEGDMANWIRSLSCRACRPSGL